MYGSKLVRLDLEVLHRVRRQHGTGESWNAAFRRALRLPPPRPRGRRPKERETA